MLDKNFMLLAIEEAKKGIGFTSPNPLVGAVIVKDGKIIGKGYHKKCGEAHAEINALKSCSENPKGATLYVTLEPCCHYGKTPPCTKSIIEKEIGTVIIGSRDPNPLVSGKGAAQLQENDIPVIADFMRPQCDALNKIFFHSIKFQKPYVVMKYAMTADGKISTCTNQSRWITGEKSRENVHKSRHALSAIMVGVETVINDNPLLTCRLKNGRSPIRIICDTHLRTPLDSHLAHTAKDIKTMLATASSDNQLKDLYRKKGFILLEAPLKNKHLNLNALMTILYQKGIDSILLEGGGTLNFSALQEGIVNKIEAYIAPKIFGGKDAKTPVEGFGIETPSEAFLLHSPVISTFDEDIFIEWEVQNKCSPEL